MGEVLTSALLVALVVLAVAGLAATVYLWIRFQRDQRRPRSRFLLTVCSVSTLIEAGSAIIAFLVIRRLLGYDSLPWSVTASAFALLLLESGPIIFAVVVYLVRRHRVSNRPVVDVDGEAR